MDMPIVEFDTTHGAIVIELDAQKAPVTVANFLDYVESGHYDGTVFHRVIDGFMIQGGGMDSKMNEKRTGTPIKNEANNGLKNDVGTIAMARTSDPHSATAQFFINVKNNDFLNYTSPTPQSLVRLQTAWTWSTKSKAWRQGVMVIMQTYRPRQL